MSGGTELAVLFQDDLSDVPARYRNEINRWRYHVEDCLQGHCTRAAVARQLGVSVATVNRKVAAVRRHGLRGLVPDYKGPKALPEEFEQFVIATAEKHQRNSRQAFRVIKNMWTRRDPIPGYAGHPGWPNLPRGWSERTFYRVLKSKKFTLKAMRNGLGKARADHGPKTYSTRVGLWPFSHLVIDDVEIDNFVHVLDAKQQCRVQELGILDVLSASRFMHGTHAVLKRADGTADELKEANTRFLVAHYLYKYGYSPRGTEFVVEHRTATLPDWVMEIFDRYTSGVLTFRKGPWTGKEQAVAGMYRGRGGGNPRWKAPLESLHSLNHNYRQALPGQTGMDVAHRPEQLHGMLRHTDDLLKAAALMPEHLQRQLKFPTLEYYSQFIPVNDELHRQLDRRTDHNLEGWAECRYLTTDYRLSLESPDWISQDEYLALPAPAQYAIAEMARSDRRYQRPRKLSPYEVMQLNLRQKDVLTPAPIGMIAELLYKDLAVPRRCEDHYFTFKDIEVQPETMRFESCVTTPDHREMELTDRETYDTIVNPFDPSMLWVFSAVRERGKFLGLAHRDNKVCRADLDALARRQGRNAQRLAGALTETRARHADTTRQRAADDEHNYRLITGDTPESRKHARKVKRNFQGSSDELLDESENTEQPVEQSTAPEPGGFSADELLDD